MRDCVGQQNGTCASPSNPQPLENFAKDAKRKGGLTPRCKACQKAYRDANKLQTQTAIRAWRQQNPDKMKAYRVKNAAQNTARMRKWREANRLQKLYGISRDDWSAMLAKQNYACAICDVQHEILALHVDHCHDTNRVRGLLCLRCNTGLGNFKDSAEKMQRAIEYLQGF